MLHYHFGVTKLATCDREDQEPAGPLGGLGTMPGLFNSSTEGGVGYAVLRVCPGHCRMFHSPSAPGL